MRLPMAVPPVVGFAALYLIAVVAGARTTMGDSGALMIWPAIGVAAIWMAVSRESRWRWAELAAVPLLTVAGLIAAGTGVPSALAEAPAATVGALVFTVAAGRRLPGDGGAPLSNLLDLWRLMLCAVLAATAATLTRTAGGLLLAETWAFSPAAVAALIVRDVVAVLVFGSATLLIVDLVRGHRHGLTGLPTARWLECGAVFAVSAAAYWAVFSQEKLPIGFVLIPLAVWAAIRMPTPLVILHAVVFSCVALSYTRTGHGPYAAVQDTDLSMLLIQFYAGVLASVGLALALSRDERDTLIQRLQTSEEEATDKATMMTTVVNSMTEGLAILDHTGRLVLRNPAAGRLLGAVHTVTGGVALGSDHGFFQPDGTPLTDAELPHVRALAGEEAAPMDILIRNSAVPEGRVVRFNVARLALGAGPSHVVVVFHDVTADRRHRDELMSFAGRVAHNLLNPLTTIEGWSEVLEQELAGYQPVERVERIQRAAARMRTFLNGLLSYTAARDGKLMPTTVNLALLVGDVINSRLDQAESTGAAPPYFEVGRLDPVEADPVLLRQLLENLIDNSLRMMGPGVGPYLAISCQPAPNGLLRIDILDNSVGIPPGKRHEIFTNFHREKGSASNGLELAICKRIVERHGGTIEATANPYATGTRMSFTLPAGRSAYARTLAASQ
ncbi:ATP-binding protein [Actinoplanes sp. NEAU-A12]|uniref:Sensor-like histidine kinase SenX3 n=1 Tax=Actinoplanes sandaracinus TaxID=3045177 RepID=A0ABT6WS21_9ACTN|nr:ATP-binding protein [Actinoplanes sandaracinus]MDI6102537.1 ATP-binding protein [Actinoplanes sandaracinus]